MVPGSVYELGATALLQHGVGVLAGGRARSRRIERSPRRRGETACCADFVVPDTRARPRRADHLPRRLAFEIACQLAWLGADLILNVVQTPTVDREQEVVLVSANAIVNQVFVASVNAVAG